MAVASEPAGHSAHELLPALGAYLPRPQEEQDALPLEAAKEPGLQRLQPLAPEPLLLPALQKLQPLAPLPLKVPAPHTEQELLPLVLL